MNPEPGRVSRTAAMAAGAVRLIERRAIGEVMLIVVSLWMVVFVLDYVTGPKISCSIFYLLPIAVVSLRFGQRAGLLASVLGAITWFGADRLSGGDGFGGLIPVWNGLVRLGLFAIVSVLLVAVRDLLFAQRREARIDALTAVLNSRGFRERAQVELDRARRTGHPISIAYIDVDNFKRLNDARGHSAGDEALRRIGETFAACARSLDVVGRLGGDEFAIVFPDCGPAEVERVVLRSRAMLRPLCTEFDVDLSVGIVTFDEVPPDLDTALRRADALMYVAKGAGRGFVRHDTEPSRRDPRRPPSRAADLAPATAVSGEQPRTD